jgi:hypothetical protein
MQEELQLEASPSARHVASRPLVQWFVDELLVPIFKPLVTKLKVWSWADENVHLDEKSRSEAAPYDSGFTPWTREYQETATDPAWDEDHVIKSSRTGFTEASLNVLRFAPEHMPGQALYAIDSAEEVKKISKDRLIPTLRQAAAGALTDDPDDITSKVIRLATMIIHLAGSYSAGIFRNKWLRIAILDEVEVNPTIAGEGTLHDLARSRQTDVVGSKLFTLSKPTRWGSPHHRECATGTMSSFRVPCPHCGTFQELSLDGIAPTSLLRYVDHPEQAEVVKVGRLRYEHCRDLTGEWDFQRLETETWYECVNGCRIDETPELKHSMMNAGVWEITNPRHVPRKRSRHISDLYSLHPKMTWGRFASLYVEAISSGEPDKLMHFWNNHNGMPWKEKASTVSEENVLELRSPYLPGSLPFEPDAVIIGCDSQDAFWKYVVIGVKIEGAGGADEVAVSRWGIAPTPAEILAEPDTPVSFSTGERIPDLGFIDAGGHRTDEVYDLFDASERKLIPCFGRAEATLKTVVWKRQTTHRLRPIDIYFVADSLMKRRLYLSMIGKVRDIKQAIDKHASGQGPTLAALGLPGRLHIPGGGEFDTDLRSLISELQGEVIDDKGQWHLVSGHRNDYGDALKYALACWEYVRPVYVELRAERLTRKT